MSNEIVEKLGPLAALAGIWEGSKGSDRAPSDDRGVENNPYRERVSFEPFGPVNNHEQELYGLKYSTVAWNMAEPDKGPFHEEVGYWLWDAKAKQVMRCFLVPRGVALIAGGTVEENATSFKLSAEVGSSTYGICSNLFLDQEFKTVRYDLVVTVNSDGSFSYEQNSQLQMKGRKELFQHIDKNTLHKVSM